MAILQQLDEEFFQIQDYLSTLVDTLPIIDLDSIPDTDSLIRSLIEQNKAFGNQIISLYKTLDSVTSMKTPKADVNNSQSFVSSDFVAKLQDKIKEYEDVIQELSIENEQLFSQIRDLSQQVKSIQAKQEQQNSSIVSNAQNGDNLTGPQILRPMSSTRTTTQQTPNDMSFDIEHMFIMGDFKKASDILAHIDYKRPHNIPLEKFNNWLIITNRLKDSELNEMFSRLKVVMDAVESEDVQERTSKHINDLEESLDQAGMSPLDRLISGVEEKLARFLSNKQQRASTRSTNSNNKSELSKYNKHYERVSQIREASEHLETEGGHEEQLQEKVIMLKEDLISMERELQERQEEVEILKERLGKMIGGSNRQGTLGNETLAKDLENEMRNRVNLENHLQEVINENEELRERHDALQKQNEACNRRIRDLFEQLNEKDQIIDKFVRNSEKTRKNTTEANEELIEKMKEEISIKTAKIAILSKEISELKESRRGFMESRSSSSRKSLQSLGGGEDLLSKMKEDMVLESGLHVQENLLFTLKQVFKDVKDSLLEISEKSSFRLSQGPEAKHGFDDGVANAKTETQKILKENNKIIQDLLREIYIVKTASYGIMRIFEGEGQLSPKNLESLTQRIQEEEQNLIEKLTKCLKGLSHLRTLVCDMLVASEDPQNANNKALGLLQDLYANINQVIYGFPELSNEVASLGKKSLNRSGSASEYRRPLIKDLVIKEGKVKFSTDSMTSPVNRMKERSPQNFQDHYDDNQNLLHKQLQEKDAVINEMMIIFSQGIEKTNQFASELAKIADSDDASVLVGNILNEIDMLKIRAKELFEFTQGKEIERQYTKDKGWSMPSGNSEEAEPRHQSRTENHKRFPTNSNVSIIEGEEQFLKKLEELERENNELKEYKVSADIALRKTQDQNAQLKLSYFSEINALKEEKKLWFEEKQMIEMEIERKEQDIAKLNQLLDSLQNFSNKQLEVVKDKEQLLQTISSQKRDYDQIIRDLEKNLQEAVRERQELSEKLVKRDEQVEVLKKDFTETMDKLTKAQEELRQLEMKFVETASKTKTLTDEWQGLTEGKGEMEEKVRKLNELLKVTRNELKNCRQLIEEKNYEIGRLEDEIHSLKETLRRERSLNKESDLIVHLKGEIQAQDAEIEMLRRKNAELLRFNESLQSETTYSSGNKLRRSDNFIKEIEKIGNSVCTEGTEALKRSLKKRSLQQNLDKSELQEYKSLQKTVSESNWNVENFSKDFGLSSDPRNSKLNILSPRDINSRKISVADEKDQEIQRLNSVVRDLAKSLGLSSEPMCNKYRYMKFSSPN